MIGKEILLNIRDNKIWFNNTDYIDISQSDIPHQHITFKTKTNVFWSVKMNTFNKESGKLSVKILNYNENNSSAFQSQKPRYDIKSIVFGVFDWLELEPLLSSYQKNKFINQLENIPIIEYTHTKNLIKGKSAFNQYVNTQIEDKDPINKTYDEEFTIDFNDCVFISGAIEFSKHFNRNNQQLKIQIQNDNIRPQFDNIKQWFSRKLKTKKIRVKIVYTLTDNNINIISVKSEDIDKIDQNLIESIKIQRTLDIVRAIRPDEIDKTLFTSDNLYSLYIKDDSGENIFGQTEIDILDTLIKNSNVRNKRELNYLSSHVQSLNYKIRFTSYPNFGFIFLAEGKLNNHFIWELLNSHATYVWTIEKGDIEIELQYNRIESTINKILKCGRDEYKKSYKTKLFDIDLICNFINHTEKDTLSLNGFPRWKQRIHELIT